MAVSDQYRPIYQVSWMSKSFILLHSQKTQKITNPLFEKTKNPWIIFPTKVKRLETFAKKSKTPTCWSFLSKMLDLQSLRLKNLITQIWRKIDLKIEKLFFKKWPKNQKKAKILVYEEDFMKISKKWILNSDKWLFLINIGSETICLERLSV